MTWFKVDDGFHGHPKVIGLPPSAVGVWLLAGTWAAQYLTDGAVPAGIVLRLGGTAADAAELTAAGLWEATPDGYRFHEWAEYQPDAASEKAKRGAESAGGVRGNHLRWHVGRRIHVDTCEFCNQVPDSPPQSGTQSDTQSDTQSPPDQVPDSPPNPPDPYPTRPVLVTTEDGSFSSEVAEATSRRDDVEELLDLLDAEIVRNGSKVPKRSKTNRDAMRLMLDRDKHEPAQIAHAILWCQQDPFWRSNILSAVKLREKYDQLRLAAQRQREGTNKAQQRQEASLANVAQLAAIDASRAKGLSA